MHICHCIGYWLCLAPWRLLTPSTMRASCCLPGLDSHIVGAWHRNNAKVCAFSPWAFTQLPVSQQQIAGFGTLIYYISKTSVAVPSRVISASVGLIIIWLLLNLGEASFELFRYLLLGNQLKPCKLYLLVSYTSRINLNLLWYYPFYFHPSKSISNVKE